MSAQLTIFSIAGDLRPTIDDDDILSMVKEYPENVQFNAVYLHGCKKITDMTVKLIVSKHFRTIQRISLGYCPLITDDAVEYVAKWCRGLIEFNLEGCKKITDKSVRSLALTNPSKLSCLDLSKCNITDKSILNIMMYMLNVQVLLLDRCSGLTADSLNVIEQNSVFLKRLNVVGCSESVRKRAKEMKSRCSNRCLVKWY